MFALRTALKAAEIVGIAGVITHPLDDAARTFYARWGFDDLPFDPRRAMVLRMTCARFRVAATPELKGAWRERR